MKTTIRAVLRRFWEKEIAADGNGDPAWRAEDILSNGLPGTQITRSEERALYALACGRGQDATIDVPDED